MVKIINDSIFKGIAGKRPTTKPTYFVLHNDAGAMTPERYQNWLQDRFDNGQSNLGFAHYYINRNAILRVEDTYNVSWACGDWRANQKTISYEVCEQLTASDQEFISNENMTLRQMAVDMLFYGMAPTKDNIKFHKEFVSTSCPARSLELHGGLENLRNYVIKQIEYYQSFGKLTVEELLEAENDTPKGEWKQDETGWWYVKPNGNYCKNEWQPIAGKWYYFDNSGYAYKDSWLHYCSNWYYFDSNCNLVTNNTIKINNKWYNFNLDGTLHSETLYYN